MPHPSPVFVPLPLWPRPDTPRKTVARLGRNRQHVAELHKSIRVGLFFHPDHIARRDTILLSTCADHHVHKLSLCSCGDGCPVQAEPSSADTILCLLVSRNGL